MLPGNSANVPVEVLHRASGFGEDTEDGWFPGFIEHRRRNAAGEWEAYVRYTRGVGEQYVGWFGYDRIRQADGEQPSPSGGSSA